MKNTTPDAQRIGQSATITSSPTRSRQRRVSSWFLMCTGPSTNPESAGMERLSLPLGLPPSTSSAAQRWPLSVHIPALLQDNAAAVSSVLTKGNCTPLQGVLLSLASLLPATFTPSAFGPSCPPCQIIPWSQITTAEQLQFEFPLQCTHKFIHPGTTTHVSLHTPTEKLIHVPLERGVCTHISKGAHVHTNMHSHPACQHACTDNQTHAYTCVLLHACICIQIYMHAPLHRCTHIKACIYITCAHAITYIPTNHTHLCSPV